MNSVFIIGRITKDLELKKTSTDKDIVNYSIANNITKDITEFINCTTFGESAKTLCEYCSKGDLIGIEGQLRTSQYVDSENKKHTSYYVLTNKVHFLHTSKSKDDSKEVKSIEKTDITIDDSDLPF